MKKRLISLCLCFATLLVLLLTGCAEETDVSSDVDKAEAQGAITMTMWVVSEEKVNEKSAALVTEAINNLTQTNYKVKMVIKYFTEDEYYQALSGSINAYTDTFVPSKDIVKNEDEEAFFDIYPALQKNQVDILYIGDLHDKNGNLTVSGADMYDEMVEKGWLAPLNTYLDGSAKKIRDYISPTLLSGVQRDGQIYAVPNNNVIGEYTYMLLNQELMDRYSMSGYFKSGKINAFHNSYVYRYIDMVLADTANNQDILPIDATYDECLSMLAHYWSVDPATLELGGDDFSLFGALSKDFGNLKNGLVTPGAESLFTNEAFVADYLQLNKYRLNDSVAVYSNGTSTTKTPALTFKTGALQDVTVEDGVSYYDLNGVRYYAVPVAYPVASEEDLYDGMFGVCSINIPDGTRVQRCMEILAFFNTNATARNLLQYGVEGQHYNLVSGSPQRTELGNGYKMDIYATGNAFLAYPESWMAGDIWENGKLQNRDSSISTLSGFHLPTYAAAATKPATAPKLESVSKAATQLTYSSGYSKEILSQNDLLNTWLKACDKENKKSVYVYRAWEKVGKNLVSTWYIYNTMGTADFSISTKSIMETDREIGLDITFAYTNQKNSGYTLSVINGVVPQDYKGKLYCTVGGKDTGYSLTSHKANFDVDFLNTNTYSIDVYDNLTLAHFHNNTELYQTLLAWKNAEGTDAANYSVQWASVVDGVTYQNFVFYRKNLKNVTTVALQPKGDTANLSLQLNYTTHAEKVSKDYLNYALTYVRVKADSGVTLSGDVAYTLDGKADKASLEATVSDQDLGFTLAGALDLDLIRYIENLNTDLIAILDACTDYTIFKAVVKDLSLLLDPTKEAVADDFAVDEIREYAASVDLTELRNNIRRYLSTETGNKALDLKKDEVIEELNESVVYYYSPFGIYTQWANATLPLPKQ